MTLRQSRQRSGQRINGAAAPGKNRREAHQTDEESRSAGRLPRRAGRRPV